jgi:NADPH:quinone reductase-like Zn-dependent oxidoreductase/short-subunit dehydrogenase
LLGDRAEPYAQVVVLSALDTRASHSPADPLAVQSDVIGPALHLLQAFGTRAPAELWLVTRGAQRFADDAGELHAPLWGLGAVLDHELPDTRCRMIDLDPGDDTAVQAAALLAEARRGPDRENRIALSGGRRHVQRLKSWGSPGWAADDGKRWAVLAPQSRRFDDIAPSLAAASALGGDDVLIETRAVGLNFRDVLNALGMLGADAPVLGGECAGKVLAVGPKADASLVGQRVMAFARGAFASSIAVPASQVARLPADMGYADGAGLPVVFLTALYGLIDLARLAEGETVLIHSAAGGVGLAALQVARQRGARVIATAGSATKRAYLRSLGVEHVFSSRDTEFTAAVREITAGRGVDVVLNSLSDQFVAASFAALRTGGRFVELGKRGIWSREEATARRPDVRYLPFDLADVAVNTPAVIAGLFERLGASLQARVYRPIPQRSYAFEDRGAAFEYMANARHIGKLVIRMPAAADRSGALRADATYLISGAAGGLARSLAASLVARGARHLALLVRHAPNAELTETIGALRRAGATISVLDCDVASAQAIDRAVTEIEASMPPLRGVFHLAGIIDDAPAATSSWSRFVAVLAPKILGTWHLERRTRAAPLDHFVLYSSVAAVFGWPGQSAYAAGNAYLDAVARRRAASGLPAQAIDWGPWSSAGLAAETAAARGTDFAKRGLPLISREQGDSALAQLMTASASQVVAAWLEPARLPQGSLLAGSDTRAAQSSTAPEGAAARSRFRTELADAAEERRMGLAVAAVEREARRALGLKPSFRFDAARPLNELGLDSLLAVQLANALGALFDVPVSATLLFDYPTIDVLSRHLSELVLPKLVASKAATSTAAAAPTIDELSEADAEIQLLAELESLKQLSRSP